MWRRGFLLLLVAAVFGIVSSVPSAPLLGAEKCTWGPSYWCSNITNAKGCKAVSHCIKAVWEKQVVPQDDDEVCKICTDMVKQARDQLESNQTQEDLKAVFEGSCKLIPLDVVSKECIKMVDEFIPELVETLASQMNPQVVCTVAGLCNNAEIDKMLADKNDEDKAVSANIEMCDNCFSVVDKMRSNFDDITYEKFLENLLRGCGRLSSFSDACATLVFSNYETIYTHMKDNFYSDNVCHMAGTCSYKFHRHEPEPSTAAVEITPMGNVGRLEVAKEDLTCDFCKKLVIHMRDIIVANTTEEEFKQVLDGICKQTGTFKSECLSIIDQYYPMIYSFLVKELDPNEVCFMVGICQKGMKTDGPIAPLIPVGTAELAVKVMKKESEEPKIIGRDEYNSYKINNQVVKPTEKSQANVQILTPELSQLPIDRMVIQLPQSKEVCAFCQYFLHYVQTEISDDKTEEEIKSIVEKACKNLPNMIEPQCESFIEAYGDAVIALLVQEIDPSVVCPAISLCPKDPQIQKMDVLMTTGSNNKPNCPLCLFAVEQLETMLKDNSTEENIKHALETLCTHLPAKLRSECTDFVETYSKQLIEMISAEFTPQEVCVFLKLCIDNKPSPIDAYFGDNRKVMADKNRFKTPFLYKNMMGSTIRETGGSVATNEIPDYTYNGRPIVKYDAIDPKQVDASPQCIVCEFIMSQLEKELKDQATMEEIKKAVHSVCHRLPKNVKNECDAFVDKYGDLVITLLTTLSPAEVCSSMNMCPDNKYAIRETVTECAVCNELVSILNRVLNNPDVDRKMERLIEKACYALPGEYLQRCVKMMKTYGESIIHLVTHLADLSRVCGEIGVCGTADHTYLDLMPKEQTLMRKSREVKLVGTKKCSWGPSYWCENEDQAAECKALNHCRVNVWKAEKPSK